MMKSIPTYHDEYGNRVVFIPDSEIPSATHRVVVNNIPVGFLARTRKPTPTVAEFYRDQYLKMGGPG